MKDKRGVKRQKVNFDLRLMTNTLVHFFRKYLGLLLFTGALITGISTYKGYGISWDEGIQRQLGQATYNYIFHGEDSIKYCHNKEYGIAFELPLYMLEKAFRLSDSRDIFLMRHLVTHLFFLTGALFLFLLIDFLYRSKLLAAIGFLMLLSTPLIYGHSFFNSKDVPFLSMFIIGLYVMAVAFQKNNLIWYIMLGLALALLMNIRIMGILLLGCSWLQFGLDFVRLRSERKARKKTAAYATVVTFLAFGLLAATWPYLYHSPVRNFCLAFYHLSHWQWVGWVLFWGKEYWCMSIPGYYAISWFCFSNPLLYVLIGFLGIACVLISFIKTPRQLLFYPIQRNHLVYLFCFAEPLIAVAVLHSQIFDAWRHLYFIYPPFILCGIYGLNVLLKTKLKFIALSFMAINFVYIVSIMIQAYPYEYVYFNELIVKRYEPQYLRKNFEMDYWGTSYTRAFEYILKNDTSANITVAVPQPNLVGEENLWLLNPAERKRIHIIEDSSQAGYFATYYRYHPQDYPFQNKEVFSIKVMNSTIMSVFKLK